MWSAHAVYLCSELFSRSFPFQPGPAWAGRSKTSVQVTTPVYVNCRYYTSNWSSWLEWGCFPHVLWRNLLDVWFLVHFTINAFMFDWTFGGKISLSSKTTGKCNHLIKNLCGMVYINCQKGKLPRRCSGLERGTAQLWNNYVLRFGTQKNSASVFLSF